MKTQWENMHIRIYQYQEVKEVSLEVIPQLSLAW